MNPLTYVIKLHQENNYLAAPTFICVSLHYALLILQLTIDGLGPRHVMWSFCITQVLIFIIVSLYLHISRRPVGTKHVGSINVLGELTEGYKLRTATNRVDAKARDLKGFVFEDDQAYLITVLVKRRCGECPLSGHSYTFAKNIDPDAKLKWLLDCELETTQRSVDRRQAEEAAAQAAAERGLALMSTPDDANKDLAT